MHIRHELKQVMVEITEARRAVADLEALRLSRRRRLNELEDALSTARIALMSRVDAGTNDAQRRAYAERETAADREIIIEANRALTDVEIDLVHAQTTLRNAEDHRRYLETIVSIVVNDAADLLKFTYGGNGAPVATAE